MPEAARLFDHASAVAPVTKPSWPGTLRGEIGALHGDIDQRLLSTPFDLAVVPLPVRPAEELITRISRTAGWLTLTGAATGVATALFALLG